MRKLEALIPRDHLIALLNYCPDTGAFIWLQHRGTRFRAGMTAGSLRDGYVFIWIDGVSYPAHRLAFLYMTGKWPVEFVDHIDGSRANNRWANLREATAAENLQNMTIGSNNRSGFLGVGWNKSNKKWHARIKLNGQLKHLGYFDDINLAASAYAVEKSKLHTFNPTLRP